MSKRDTFYVCDQCGKSASQNSYSSTPSGWVTYSGEGFLNKLVPKHFCCEGHKLLYLNLQSENNAKNTPNQTHESYSTPTKEVDYEAIAFANAEKAKAELEKQKHEDEMALKRRQQELEEKKERQKRADELRAQGKGMQAFFVEHATALGLGFIITLIVLFFGYQALSSKSNAKEAAEINLKLEAIEDQIKLAIQDGNKEKALELTNQLVHPIHEKWEERSKFDAGFGYPYYDEYWAEKREKYKEEILKKENNTQSPINEQEEPQAQENQAENQEQTATAASEAQQTTQKYYNGCGYSYESKEDCMTQCGAFNGGNCPEGPASGQIIKASKPASENQ